MVPPDTNSSPKGSPGAPHAAARASDHASAEDWGLIVQQEGKSQQTLGKFIALLLNYRFGYQAEVVGDFMAAASVIRQRGRRIRCIFVVQNTKVSARTTVPALTLNGTIPLFLVFPGHVVEEQLADGGGLANVHLCKWETSFSQDEGSLARAVAEGLGGSEIDAIFGKEKQEGTLEERVRARLEHLDTLPTLPSVVLHIMHLISDPKTTMAQLESLLLRDPAIVLKVLRVANSPAFAGAGHKGRWTLKDALVRLGLRKVGAIAQQIALINTFVRPDDSEFDLKRFWEHSVGCALVADRLCEGGMVKLAEKVEFNEYWIGAILHDVGKLVQGFFYYDWFQRIIRHMEGGRLTYQAAESELGGGVTHELIGQLLLEKGGLPPELVQAVRQHHLPGEPPSSLAALVHVADNLAKDLGLGYGDGEKGDYQRPALAALGLTREGVRKLAEPLKPVAGEVARLVKESMDG